MFQLRELDPHDRRPPSPAPLTEMHVMTRVATGLTVLCLALSSSGCGGDATGLEDDLAAMEGTWHATLFRWTRVAEPDAPPVDLIALGGALTLQISRDGQVRMTTREVGAATSESVLGSGRIVAGDRLELDTGGSNPVTLDYALSGVVLRLTGRLSLRPAGVGAVQEVDLEAVLIRRLARARARGTYPHKGFRLLPTPGGAA